MVTRTLEGKVALITGASEPDGIGFAIARSLAQRGASVVLVARNLEKLKERHKELTHQYGGKHLYTSADVTNPQQVHDAIHSACAHYSTIDILVNNAGVAPLDYLKILEPETLKTTILTNLFGPLLFYREIIPVFERQGSGVVIDVLSQAALYVLDRNTAYGSSKIAHAYLSMDAKKELPPAVTIYRLYPGVVRTAIWKKDVSELKKTIAQSGGPALDPKQIGEFVGQLLENPSLAETHDIVLQPLKDGSLQHNCITHLTLRP